MTSRDFCFWLQGFLELAPQGPLMMTPPQVDTIKRHLSLVFIHEIDPSAGDAAAQSALSQAHAGSPPFDKPGSQKPEGTVFRC